MNNNWGIISSKIVDQVFVRDVLGNELPEEEITKVIEMWSNAISQNSKKFNNIIIRQLCLILQFDFTLGSDEADEELYESELKPFIKEQYKEKNLNWYQETVHDIVYNKIENMEEEFSKIINIEDYLNNTIINISIEYDDNINELSMELSHFQIVENEIITIEYNEICGNENNIIEDNNTTNYDEDKDEKIKDYEDIVDSLLSIDGFVFIAQKGAVLPGDVPSYDVVIYDSIFEKRDAFLFGYNFDVTDEKIEKISQITSKYFDSLVQLAKTSKTEMVFGGYDYMIVKQGPITLFLDEYNIKNADDKKIYNEYRNEIVEELKK